MFRSHIHVRDENINFVLTTRILNITYSNKIPIHINLFTIFSLLCGFKDKEKTHGRYRWRYFKLCKFNNIRYYFVFFLDFHIITITDIHVFLLIVLGHTRESCPAV